ncbi:MAG: primosomal protein N', partial [Alphaproteobacteria bacterium]
IKAKLGSGFSVNVLQGVTGSGKTEVYLKLIEDVIAQGKQALIILPEILLSIQMKERFKKRISHFIHEWHSGLTEAKKTKYWADVINGDANLVVGARSALFLPYKNLGLVIIDEEHDNSLKQEDGGCYNARDMAVLRCNIEKVPAILCSATPSIETEYNIKNGKYERFFLASRFGDSVLPQIKVVDVSELSKKEGVISPQLRDELIRNFKESKQSLLYLNRRGYVPVTLCKECKQKVTCPNCDFNLVEHKHERALRCHHCSYSQNKSKPCSNCANTEKFVSYGVGVEKIAEEVESFLPEARVQIISSDNTSTESKISEIMEKISNHEVDVLIGTQLVGKGLHFPKLDLVGILEADSALMAGDIRAYERTYQVLQQVSGRAGRESDKGIVVIQTENPLSPLIQSLEHQNYDEFVENELYSREAANMPPYSRLVLIHFFSRNEIELIRHLNHLAKIAPNTDDKIKVLGPVPAPIFILKNEYRYRFVIISDRKINIQSMIKRWIASVEMPKSISIRVDVYPISFS